MVTAYYSFALQIITWLLLQMYTNNCIKSTTVNIIIGDGVETWNNWNTDKATKNALVPSVFQQIQTLPNVFSSISTSPSCTIPNLHLQYATSNVNDNRVSASGTSTAQMMYSAAVTSTTSKSAQANTGALSYIKLEPKELEENSWEGSGCHRSSGSSISDVVQDFSRNMERSGNTLFSILHMHEDRYYTRRVNLWFPIGLFFCKFL